MATVPDRSTKINMDLVPTIEATQRSVTHEPLPSIHEAASSSKRKRILPPELYRAAKLSKGIRSASPTVKAKPALDSHALIPAGSVAGSTLDVVFESPWEHYQQVYELNLGGFVFVVSERAPPHDLFIVKQLPGVVDKIHMLQEVRHRNFHQMLECFSFEDSYFAVFGYEAVSLAHVAKSPPFLTELQLAAIVGQVLDGLAYLFANGLEPGPLDCSNILLGADGSIKITGHEGCKKATSSTQDLRPVGYITMELMQKYPNSSGSIGLEDFNHWPSDGEAVRFLAMTTSATSVDQLLSHPFLDCGWSIEDLKWIVAFAAVTTHRGYRYRGPKDP